MQLSIAIVLLTVFLIWWKLPTILGKLYKVDKKREKEYKNAKK